MDHSDSCTCTCTRTAYDTSIFDNTAVHSDQHAPIPTHSAIILPSTNLSAPFNLQRQQQQQWLPSIASNRPDREDPTFRLDQRRRAFEELFLYACPKSISETPPTPLLRTRTRSSSRYLLKTRHQSTQRHLTLFVTNMCAQVTVLTIHSFLKLMSTTRTSASFSPRHSTLPSTLSTAFSLPRRVHKHFHLLPETLYLPSTLSTVLSLHASCPHALPPPSRDTLPCHQHYGPFSLCTHHVHSPRALLPLPRDTLPCPSTLSSCASASSPRHLLTVSLCTCCVPCQVTVGWHHVYVSRCQG
jgi:hypothetical protein